MAAAAAGGGHAAGNAGAGRIGCAPDPGREAAESSLPVAAGVIAGLVAFLGALIAALHSGRRKLLCGLGAAGGYALFLLLGNLLFFGVHYGEALPVLLPLAGAGCSALCSGPGAGKSAAMHKSKTDKCRRTCKYAKHSMW